MVKTSMRRLTAIFTAFAVIVSLMPAMTVTAEAKSKKDGKIALVMQEKDYTGDSVKYTYNKKGLVTKKVAKYTSKDEDCDIITVETTTYKYNKKNRIASESYKSVKNQKYYDVSKTTGKSNGKVNGNVATITTAVTRYMYNKKGAATKSVSTVTTVKSGSVSKTDQILMIYENDGAMQVGDKYVAGYNSYNADGSTNDNDTSKNAYYYTGAITEAVNINTSTTTYKDNGNGTYTETVETTSKPSNYDLKYNYKYFKYDSDGKVIAGTEDDYDFDIVESVEVVLDASGSSETITKEETVIKDGSVITKAYKNDKKKRAVKATVTVVGTTNEARTDIETENRQYSDDDDSYWDKDDNEVNAKSTTTKTTVSNNTSTKETTDIFSYVETYKYDKKGHRKQTVYDNKGIEEGRTVYTEGPSTYQEQSEKKFSDGKTDRYSEENTYSGGTVEETVYSGGNKTVTTSKASSKSTYKETRSYPSGAENNESSTEEITYFANGGSKRVTEDSETYKNPDGKTSSTAGVTTRYNYDKEGEKYSYVETGKNTYSDGTSDEYTNSNYYDGKDSHYGFAVDDDYDTEEEKAEKAKIRTEVDGLNKATEASGTPFKDTEAAPVKANPIKLITKYSYDKSGNLKSATTTRNWTVVETLRNETYGNPVYQFDEKGEIEEIEVQVSHKSTVNKSKENTLKKGTKRASVSTTVSKSAEDRSTPSYTTGSRVTYKLKMKKINKKLAKDVELQQWMIQNPECSGTIGL